MNDRERKVAFAGAVAVLAAAAALLAWLWPAPRAAREPERVRRQPAAQTAPRSTPTPAVVEEPTRPASGEAIRGERRDRPTATPAPRRSGRRPGVRLARAFLSALLRYEAGDDGLAVRRGIRRTADPALARTILSARPRVSPGAAAPTRGRLIRLSVDPSSTDRRTAVAATIDRAGETSLMLVTVERRRGQWLVTDLG